MSSENLPVEMSADAKENAFHHYCATVGHFKNYAVCCHLMTKRKEGRLSESYSECSVAIGKKVCPAIKMRREEIEAGHAIHFVSRSAIQEASSIRDSNIVQRAVQAVTNRFKPTTSKVVPLETKYTPPPPAPKKEETFADMDYAAVISSAAKETPKPVEKQVAQVAPQAALKPEPGESMIDFAKRMMNARKTA